MAKDEFGRNVSGEGHICALCNGFYNFPSEYAHGLMFPRQGDGDRDVFLCWECCVFVFNRLSSHLSSIAYGAMFNKREPMRPTDFLPWLENTVTPIPCSISGDQGVTGGLVEIEGDDPEEVVSMEWEY
jgi:hypothetical protein